MRILVSKVKLLTFDFVFVFHFQFSCARRKWKKPLSPIQGQTFDARRRRPLDNTWEQVSNCSQQATHHWQQYLLKGYKKWHQTIIKSKQKSKSWRLRLITKLDYHQDTRDKTRASKTWSEKVASQVMCQPCPRSQLLAVYYEEQQQSRENVPRACPRKNVHIFFGNTSLNMCAMFLHAVFFVNHKISDWALSTQPKK